MEKFALSLSNSIKFRYIASLMIVMKFGLLAVLAYRIYHSWGNVDFTLEPLFPYFIAVGFFAQLVDGALGMAYGATCTSLLMGVGVPPAFATASVHTAEVFTTGFSGLSHIYFGNIDKHLFFRIVITGVVGSIIGAYLISAVFDAAFIRPFIAIYLVFLGGLILYKAFKGRPQTPVNKNLGILGLYGGFLDAIGGGGWGPLVTSNLLRKGNPPKETVGTVNTAEFFVAFFSTGVFMLFIDVDAWQSIAGLVIGGIFAAPLGAFLVKFFNPKSLMITVGVIVICTSIFTIAKVFF